MSATLLQISPELGLPLDAVTETFAILAKRRAGKSNAAVVMAEEMYDHGLPWVAIDPKGDWWGVRAAGDGKAPGLSVLVFGGMHGDVPLEPTAGQLVADLIVDNRLTCVLDVSEMGKADMRRFLLAFATRLYKRNTTALHVFCEEADEYIPQMVRGDAAAMVGAFETLVKRGGFRGIGCTLITQRSASLNKDVLTQVETLVALRTTGPQDRKAILDWVNYHADGADAVKELPLLGNGEAWVFSPQWLDSVTKVQFRRRRTFDSGATPKAGEKVSPPATLAEVDLAAIKEAMSETIEKAKADDPKHLRREIARLETELKAARADVPEPVIERVEVPVVTGELIPQIAGTVRQASELAAELTAALSTVHKATQEEGNSGSPRRGSSAPRASSPSSITGRAPVAGSSATQVRPSAATREMHPGPADGTIELRKGARRMVESLGRMHPLRLTKSQWGMVSGLKASGGTWSTYLGEIRRLGFIDENHAGYTLTDAGFDYLGERPEPMTAAELQDHYRSILRAGARRMLDALIDAYPNGLTREEIADAAEVTFPGGTFSTYLGDLTRNGLAERVDGEIVATDVLMHGANA